jgi:hypothetical protein
VLTGAGQSMSTLLHGADLTGLCLLTALLAISAWTCLRPQPVLQQTRPSAGQTFGFYLLLCAIAAPLLMFGSIAAGLGLLQKAQPLLTSSVQWQPYRNMLWLLYGVVGLQQLFALQRLGCWPAPSVRRMMPLAMTALLLVPLAMAFGLLALDRHSFQQGVMPHAAVVAAAVASISGIVLWLPAQILASRTAPERHAKPERDAMQQAAQAVQVSIPAADTDTDTDTDSIEARLGSTQEMERQLDELSALLEREKHEAGLARQRELQGKDGALHEPNIQQQVREQKFLFESGLPCNLGMLVNGLIILNQPLDLRDHVRGDSLLHAAVRNGKHLLAQHLIDNGAPLAAVNWAGLTPRACAQDPTMLELLDAAAARIAK